MAKQLEIEIPTAVATKKECTEYFDTNVITVWRHIMPLSSGKNI
jgi:hypothetical protein